MAKDNLGNNSLVVNLFGTSEVVLYLVVGAESLTDIALVSSGLIQCGETISLIFLEEIAFETFEERFVNFSLDGFFGTHYRKDRSIIGRFS